MVALAGHDGLVYRLRDKVRLHLLDSHLRCSFIIPYNSIKWVGLFVTALVGLYTIEDLWDKFGDLKMTWVRHSIFTQSLHNR